MKKDDLILSHKNTYNFYVKKFTNENIGDKEIIGEQLEEFKYEYDKILNELIDKNQR